MTAELFGSGAHRAPLHNCNPVIFSYGSARRMKIPRVSVGLIFLLTILLTERQAFADARVAISDSSIDPIDPPRFELAVESAYLLGFINSPYSYEIGAEFVTARVRWGVVQNAGWLHGYNQFYVTAMAEPIFRGVENHYFGFNTGLRYNFVRPYWRLIPYVSGGVGAGAIDSHPSVPGAQGQDFTFNILTAVGVSYDIGNHWKLDVGVLYQHLSNAEQTNPNPSLNLIGPQVGLNYSF